MCFILILICDTELYHNYFRELTFKCIDCFSELISPKARSSYFNNNVCRHFLVRLQTSVECQLIKNSPQSAAHDSDSSDGDDDVGGFSVWDKEHFLFEILWIIGQFAARQGQRK